jgi:hypothetical protein
MKWAFRGIDYAELSVAIPLRCRAWRTTMGPRRSHPTLADLLRKKARLTATRKHEQETIQEAFAARLAALGREKRLNEPASTPRRHQRTKPV